MEGYHEVTDSVLKSLGMRPYTEAENVRPQLLYLLVSHKTQSHQTNSSLPSKRVQTGTSHGERER